MDKVNDGVADELKVGDKIATNASASYGVVLHTITRVTRTRYVCGSVRFHKDGLQIIGPNRWGPFRGRIPTESDYLQVRIAKARAQLATFKVDESTIEVVETMLSARGAQ